MTETQKPPQIQDTDVFVVRKPYAQKRIPHLRSRRRLTVSLISFKKDLHIFDPDIRKRYTNQEVASVMKLIFKKVAERIIKKLWRMPFPNGVGSLYMKEAQRSNLGISTGGKLIKDTQIENLLREVRLGMRRVFLKWNKTGKRFPYRNIWRVAMSKGYFRTLKFNEIINRAEDPTRPNFRGHII